MFLVNTPHSTVVTKHPLPCVSGAHAARRPTRPGMDGLRERWLPVRNVVAAQRSGLNIIKSLLITLTLLSTIGGAYFASRNAEVYTWKSSAAGNLSAAETFASDQPQRGSAQRNHEYVDRRVTCVQPSLPFGAFHLVVGAFEYISDFDKHYLWNLGLPNMHILLYRRLEIDKPLRSWTGPCGVLVEEKLLTPNHGRDAAAFYDYIVGHYFSPPIATAFVHGHVAHA